MNPSRRQELARRQVNGDLDQMTAPRPSIRQAPRSGHRLPDEKCCFVCISSSVCVTVLFWVMCFFTCSLGVFVACSLGVFLALLSASPVSFRLPRSARAPFAVRPRLPRSVRCACVSFSVSLSLCLSVSLPLAPCLCLSVSHRHCATAHAGQ